MKRSITVLLALLLVSGCTRIGFFGDSITDVGRKELQDTARRLYYVSDVYAWPGLTTAQVKGRVEAGMADHPDFFAFIINTGTNDVAGQVLTWEVDYTQLLNLIADKPCVVLVTVNELVDVAQTAPVVTATQINAYITAQVAAHSNFRLVDWNQAIKDGEPVLSNDAVHPSDYGKQWIADHDVAAVQDCEAHATT